MAKGGGGGGGGRGAGSGAGGGGGGGATRRVPGSRASGPARDAFVAGRALGRAQRLSGGRYDTPRMDRLQDIGSAARRTYAAIPYAPGVGRAFGVGVARGQGRRGRR